MINQNLLNLKKILLSSNFNNEIISGEKELLHLLNTDYSQIFNKFSKGIIVPLFRGIKTNDSIFISKPRKRKSINFTDYEKSINFYTTLFSETLPSWSKFPKRNHSIICATYSSGLDTYGNIYMIFPENNSLISLCPKDDFWYAFQNTLNIDLDDFELFIKTIIKNTGFNIKIFKTNKDILKFFNYLSKYDFNNFDRSILKRFSSKGVKLFEYIVSNKKDLVSFFDNILSPTKNGFKLSNVNDLDKNINGNKIELWFDNKCLCIEYNNKNLELLSKYIEK